jgi:hypothetical protein
MPNYNRIAFVKTGWSEWYQGGLVSGRHSYINEYEEAYEKYNFLPIANGKHYAYIPPIGKKERPPQPKENDGWLIIFVAAKNGKGKLTIVGWYENATFHSNYLPRPEYKFESGFETDNEGMNYSYCISSENAYLVPPNERTKTISGKHFGRTPVIYVKGVQEKDDWRKKLSKLAQYYVTSESNNTKKGWGFPDKEHRDKVEEISIEIATKLLKKKKYKIKDRQKDNCGYDLLATRDNAPTELHVEVKGTSNKEMSFFISKNEKEHMLNPKWRLLIVTEALTNPRASLLNAAKVEKLFEFTPISWLATLPNKT